MKSSAKKVELAPYDDLFSTEESRQDAKLEKVREIPLSELHPFKNHPFKVKDDEAMMETADSVRQYGVLVPAIARPDPEGGYELVAGHRRHRASELAEKETMPVIVRDLDDDAATIIMVDSNLQRESLLPSERAFAYEAAQKLAADFGLDPKPPTAAAMVKPKRPYIRQLREDEMLCFRVLTNYLHLLEDWKVRYAPKTPEDALDDRFVEACQMHCHIEYMADVLTVGDLEERVALVDKLMQDGKIAFLQEYITRKKKEVAHHGEEPENA